MKINEKNLCVFARTPPFDMEGFLNKRGEVNKAFQRRYFVLKGNLLFYFESRLDKEPLGLIIVEGCTIELSLELDDNYCFEIAFNGNRTYILSADTQESMEAWMKALTCAGYEYKRIIVAELQRQLQEIEDSRNNIQNARNDTAQSDINVSGKPQPPPRRQNPFNRTAPPPPVVMSPLPFAHGHFGSSNARVQQEQQSSSYKILTVPDNGNISQQQPQITPKASPSIFYNDQPTVPPRNTTVLASNHIDHKEQQRRLTAAIKEFKLNHEHFREIVMPDIVTYRKQRTQPLIQF